MAFIHLSDINFKISTRSSAVKLKTWSMKNRIQKKYLSNHVLPCHVNKTFKIIIKCTD